MVLFWTSIYTGLVALWSYMLWRGLSKNEFRERGRSGWHRYETYSFSWWSGIVSLSICLIVLILVFALLISRGELGLPL
jgi:hypothetical protein